MGKIPNRHLHVHAANATPTLCAGDCQTYARLAGRGSDAPVVSHRRSGPAPGQNTPAGCLRAEQELMTM